MTDRELLELAAKAAGITGKEWNPLADDGDALRLAMKLKLDLFFHPTRIEAHIAGGRIPPIYYIAREEYADDPYAATRRAIVRAAAQIGEQQEHPQ